MKVNATAEIEFDFQAEVRMQVKKLLPGIVRIANMSQNRKKRPAGVLGQIEILSMPYLKEHDLTLEEMKSGYRGKAITEHRHILFYILNKYYDFNFSEIGRSFGLRDHSTVLKAVDKIDGYQKVYPEWRLKIKAAFELY